MNQLTGEDLNEKKKEKMIANLLSSFSMRGPELICINITEPCMYDY